MSLLTSGFCQLRLFRLARGQIAGLRRFSTTTNNNKNESGSLERSQKTDATISTGEKVRQTGRDASYLGVVLLGTGLTGAILYAVFRELLSRDSPNGVYTQAFELVSSDHRVKDSLGAPLKGYGETSARGRRRHISHLEYQKDGCDYMRMQFNVEGSRQKGKVLLEMKKDSSGHYDFRYLIVEVSGSAGITIIVRDSR